MNNEEVKFKLKLRGNNRGMRRNRRMAQSLMLIHSNRNLQIHRVLVLQKKISRTMNGILKSIVEALLIRFNEHGIVVNTENRLMMRSLKKAIRLLLKDTIIPEEELLRCMCNKKLLLPRLLLKKRRNLLIMHVCTLVVFNDPASLGHVCHVLAIVILEIICPKSQELIY